MSDNQVIIDDNNLSNISITIIGNNNKTNIVLNSQGATITTQSGEVITNNAVESTAPVTND